MDAGTAVHLMAKLLWMGVLISAPVLGVIMAVGIAISILQVVTQVQEMSLTFVPKLVATVVTLVVLGPWMLRKLTQFSTELWSSIPSLFN
jgi:flagellar biosynthetic protein FliQ